MTVAVVAVIAAAGAVSAADGRARHHGLDCRLVAILPETFNVPAGVVDCEKGAHIVVLVREFWWVKVERKTGNRGVVCSRLGAELHQKIGFDEKTIGWRNLVKSLGRERAVEEENL